MSIQVPCLEVEYWGSFALQKGFRCMSDSGSFAALYEMSPRPWNDGLKRTPVSDWTTVRSSAEWLKLRADVLQATAEDGPLLAIFFFVRGLGT
eukprot:m.278128 g.278128  ORF g.278128 m.278128 type:complete len:93 (+) comp40610_c1_seq72:829-1107(+)